MGADLITIAVASKRDLDNLDWDAGTRAAQTVDLKVLKETEFMYFMDEGEDIEILKAIGFSWPDLA